MILTTATTLNKTAIKTKGVFRSLTNIISGPSESVSSEELIYKVTDYVYVNGKVQITEPTPDQFEIFEADKDNILWVMWVSGGLMDARTDYITIVNRDLIVESNNDFTKITKKQDFINAFNDNGYIEAKVETIIEDGERVNQLRIKLSKWLDGRDIHVEAYRGSVSHNYKDGKLQETSKPWSKKTTVKATPEIIQTQWLNSERKKITSIGYDNNVFFSFDSLGLKGKTITIQLFDNDFTTEDDSLLWNEGAINHTFTVTERTMLIPYQVEAINSSAYENGFGDIDELFDSDLEIYVKLSTNEEQITIPEDTKFAEILLTPDQSINPYFATVENIVEGENSYTKYKPLEGLYPGSKVTLVAECINIPDNTEITFSIREVSSILVPANTDVPLYENGIEKTVFSAVVINGFASVEVLLQEIDSEIYNQWVEILVPTIGSDVESSLILNASLDGDSYNSSTTFKIIPPKVIQRIYHNGLISKENYVENLIRKITFIYHTETNREHNLGTFDVIWAQKWSGIGECSPFTGKTIEVDYVKRKGLICKNNYYLRDGNKKTPLVRIFNKNVSEGNPNITNNVNNMFEFKVDGEILVRLSENTDREYFNPESLAGLLGAIIHTGYTDVVINGCTGEDGTGAPSLTHVNGYNIDFKYLRTDGNRARIDIHEGAILVSSPLLDRARQNQFIESAYIYGYARSIKNVSWFFSNDDKTETNLLNRCKTSNPKKKATHHDHLHMQGFIPRYKS